MGRRPASEKKVEVGAMRRRRQMLGLAAALVFAAAGNISGYAAPVLYDETADAYYGGQALNFDAGTPMIYPGDAIFGPITVYLGAENAEAGQAEALGTDDAGTTYWVNNSAAVYEVTDATPQAEAAEPQTEMVQQVDEAGNPVYDEAGNPVMVPESGHGP